MSEQVCACGHAEKTHGGERTECFGGGPNDEMHLNCECERFRPCLDWPDAEGWWWMKSSSSFESDWLVYAMQSRQQFLILVAGTDAHFPQHEFEERHRWCADGPARFVRLLETSPFPAPN